MVFDALIVAKSKSTLLYYENGSRTLSKLYFEKYRRFFMQTSELVLENDDLTLR